MRNGSFGFLSGLIYLTLTSRTELFSIYVQFKQHSFYKNCMYAQSHLVSELIDTASTATNHSSI